MASLPGPRSFWALRRLLGELKPHRAAVLTVLVLGLVVSAIQPACVKLTESILDQLRQGVSEAFLRRVPLLIVGLFAASGFAKYFHNAIRRRVSEQVICKLRLDLFSRFVCLPVGDLQDRRGGEMLSSLQNDLAQVAQGLDTLVDLFKEPIAFLGLIAVAFYCDWQLALLTLVAAPIVVTLFSRTGAAVKRYSARNLTDFSDLMSITQESIAGAPIVKVFRLERPLVEKFERIQGSYFRTLWKSIKVQELAVPMVELVGASLMGFVIYYGGSRIASGAMTSGQLVAFVIAIGLAQMPIKKLNNAFLRLKAAEAAAERVFRTLDGPAAEPVLAAAEGNPRFERDIEFDGVTLAYRGNKRALSRISFRVRKGEAVAFVGQSGSGKSSLVNLVPRLFDPTEGVVRVDGRDVREVPLSELRRLVSCVTQDTFLFHDTIYENIRYGRLTATREEVTRAAEQANCLAFIERLPERFETVVGDRGARLSGGERQRVAIARALLKDAPILILDEATSNLDSESEALVQAALEKLMKGKTTFLVAHRLSTIVRADRIFVLRDGLVEETGTHEDLMRTQGAYSRLFTRQMPQPTV